MDEFIGQGRRRGKEEGEGHGVREGGHPSLSSLYFLSRKCYQYTESSISSTK